MRFNKAITTKGFIERGDSHPQRLPKDPYVYYDPQVKSA
jgi:hypothetical protein